MMKFSRWATIAVSWGLLVACTVASAQVTGVTVNRTPVVVVRRTFDPNNQPAEMPKLTPPEAAVTVSQTGCSAQMEVAILQQDEKSDGTYHAKVRVESVNVKTQLKVTIWLPTDSTKKISDHEEGHRQIAELFYKHSDRSAHQLAEPYIGRTLEADAGTADAAVDRAIKNAISQLTGDYMDQCEAPAARAQTIYDSLTRHGTNKLPEKDAIKQAIDDATGGKGLP